MSKCNYLTFIFTHTHTQKLCLLFSHTHTHAVYMQHLMTCRSERESWISAFMAMQCSQCDERNVERENGEGIFSSGWKKKKKKKKDMNGRRTAGNG